MGIGPHLSDNRDRKRLDPMRGRVRLRPRTIQRRETNVQGANAYHAHNLSRTVSYLMSDECKSFKNFQQRRARQPPFRQFCVELANDLNIEVVPPSMYESCSNDDNGQMMRRTEDGGDNAASSGGVNISYNKREAYFSKLSLIERRKNRRANHQPISVNRQSSCVWCCRIDHSTGQKHTRHGMKTTWKCSVCEVPLCKRPRYNGQSCFLLFHEAETLFDPCCAEAQSMQLSVRAHSKNRQPPPPRPANNVSAGCVCRRRDSPTLCERCDCRRDNGATICLMER